MRIRGRISDSAAWFLNRDTACQARGGGLHFENVHRPKRAKVKVTDAKSTARMMRKRWQVGSQDLTEFSLKNGLWALCFQSATSPSSLDLESRAFSLDPDTLLGTKPLTINTKSFLEQKD
jgi:hypothetical protein